MRLQHNIMAKSAYRSYKNNVSGMKKSLERLASGYKINRSADDAAGLAISEKMRAQITGEEAAQKNAKDGISLVQTAEGALAEVHDILDRMVELATQSANGTYDDDTDRYQLQKEMDQLMGEIYRIADSSNFNGIPLLDGSLNAGGDVVFTPGSFQINNNTLHPAGLDAGSIELPNVGPALGEDTVLHSEGVLGSSTNAFSLDLHNVILNANSTISIAVGDGVSITVTNHSDEPVTAKDIAAAINGDSSKKISVDFGDAKVGKSERGNVTVMLGKDSVFELSRSGTRLTFTQTSGGDIKMPKEVTITDAETPRPDVEGSSGITQTQAPDAAAGTSAQYTIDLSRVNVSAPGWVTVSALGREFDLEITADEFMNRGSTSIGKVLAGKLADALNDAGFPDDAVAGSLSFQNNNDGTITLTFGTRGATPSNAYDLSGVTVKTADYQSITVKDDQIEMTVDFPSDDDTLATSSATVTIGGKTYVIDMYGPSIPDGVVDDPDHNHYVVAVEGGNWERKVVGKLSEILATENAAKRQNNATYNEISTKLDDIRIDESPDGWVLQYRYTTKQYIGISDNTGSGGSGDGSGSGSDGSAAVSKNFSGDYNKSTTVLQSRSGSAQDRLASTWFGLDKLADSDGHIAEGTAITIGRNTYTFTYDTNKLGKDGYVVLNGGEKPDSLSVAAEKLTKAAENNGTYTVGYDKNDAGQGFRITITEKEGQTYFDLTTMEGIEKSLGFKLAETTYANESLGLTLQIGDTDGINSQLKINIKDCHPKALGIDAISIARQEDAAAAVDKIRAAVDYVSDVRGGLGAAQNRLDHTVNNLAVMAENVQDSESSIRDADIAEEMMAYTKNNILIQSAQSMLAQANQVPQGVLQLLQ